MKLRALGIGLVSFLFASGCIHLLFGSLGEGLSGSRGLTEKMNWYEKHAGEIDTLFIGSSSSFRDFDPSVFDSALRARGVKSKSFNLSMGSVNLAELERVVDLITRIHSPSLKRVFIDPTYDTEIEWPNLFSQKIIRIHTFEGLGLFGSYFALKKIPVRVKVESMFPHGLAFLMNCFNAGALGEVATREAGPNKMPVAHYAGKNGDGFVTFEDELPDDLIESRHTRFLNAISTYQEGLKTYEKQLDFLRIPVEELSVLRKVISKFQSVGTQVVLVLTPSSELSWSSKQTSLAALGEVPIVAYNIPSRYPELYAPENVWDDGHLNRPGATKFSTLLADRLLELGIYDQVR